MMNEVAVKKGAVYIMDLMAIEDDGAFPCPKCGTIISPDDETEEVYKIIETKVVNDELSELVIMCENCGSTIRISGFQRDINDLTL